MSLYKELDDAICEHIGSNQRIHPIYNKWLLSKAAQELGRGDLPFGDDKEWRLIDRRLQALKKSGRIRFVRESGQGAQWKLVDS